MMYTHTPSFWLACSTMYLLMSFYFSSSFSPFFFGFLAIVSMMQYYTILRLGSSIKKSPKSRETELPLTTIYLLEKGRGRQDLESK